MAKRKVISTVTKPNYVVEDLRDPPKRDVEGYRTVRRGNHLIRVAILKRKGPRGGRTVATSVWHPKSERKASSPRVTQVLKRAKNGGGRRG